MIAFIYPLLSIFWSIFIFFGFIIWIWVLVMVFTDIFRSPDMGGVHKALWFIFVLFLPILGAFFYLIVRGGKMQEHSVRAAQARDEAFKQYVRDAAGADGSPADQLAKLADLAQRGVITQNEFEQQKAKILG